MNKHMNCEERTNKKQRIKKGTPGSLSACPLLDTRDKPQSGLYVYIYLYILNITKFKLKHN